MLKKSLFLSVVFLSSLAHAVPNSWMSDANMGITEFNLVNANNQGISFSCWSSSETNEPSFSYVGDWKNLEGFLEADIEGTHGLSLKIDDNTYYPHPFYWSEFLTAISRGTKIEVFSNNKLLAVFTPTRSSINQTAKYIQNDCSYDLWR